MKRVNKGLLNCISIISIIDIMKVATGYNTLITFFKKDSLTIAKKVLDHLVA